jgi:hypothetical protein
MNTKTDEYYRVKADRYSEFVDPDQWLEERNFKTRGQFQTWCRDNKVQTDPTFYAKTTIIDGWYHKSVEDFLSDCYQLGLLDRPKKEEKKIEIEEEDEEEEDEEPGEGWECLTCTFINNDILPKCEMCRRPKWV